jgi:hypothetical protein
MSGVIPWHVRRRLPQPELLRCWPEIVGDYLASRLRPVGYSRSQPETLLLAVQGAALRQEVGFISDDIIAKLSQAGFAVQGLKLITAGALPQAKASPAHASTPPPPYPDWLEKNLASIENSSLREALRQLWLNNFNQQRNKS